MRTYSGGWDVDNFEELSREDRDQTLIAGWARRGPLYGLVTTSLLNDYAPEFLKHTMISATLISRPERYHVTLLSCQNVHSYMMLGWETGIQNEFNSLMSRSGMAHEQVMELVIFSQLYAGMRGLGHVYRAVGDFLPAYGPPVDPPAPFPEGWAADPEAFKSGLDLSTREMTKADLDNLTGWYEQTIGYVPKSIEFGLKYHPEFVKVNRAKWEVAIRTLPKQVVPYLMLRHNLITQNTEGIKESALLGKAWGIAREHLVLGIIATATYFTSFEGLSAAAEALERIFEDW